MVKSQLKSSRTLQAYRGSKVSPVMYKVGPKWITVTGNTVIDALFKESDQLGLYENLSEGIASKVSFLSLNKLLVEGHHAWDVA
jgi:hypothetical protein